ncbi:MAG: P-loop NTPase fold protein, partial [Reyranella sp.]|nr:P-loop NTPase fold protein [Reyranella sp.]
MLTELPIDWSVRVGLLGKWGEGKTSVANWVARSAASDGHLVVWYNPWNVKSDSQLWIEFAAKLLQCFDEHGVEVEGAKTLKGVIKFKEWSEFPRMASEYFKGTQIAFGMI